MSKHLQRDMEQIHQEILSLSSMVEALIDKASRALRERNLELAREVTHEDEDVDRLEVKVEEDCLKILALHQPVAVDLRRIATVLKVNNDLERMADLAVNIAERVEGIVTHPEFPIPHKLERMVDLTTLMVRNSLDSFVNLDSQAARKVCMLDEEVDRYNREVIDELYEHMRANPETIMPAMHCFSACATSSDCRSCHEHCRGWTTWSKGDRAP